MSTLGNGLSAAEHRENALTVREAELSMLRRAEQTLGIEQNILVVQSNLAGIYLKQGRLEQALRMSRDIYYGTSSLFGEEHRDTLTAASNYVRVLNRLNRFDEAKALVRKTVPVARRVLGDNHETMLGIRLLYAQSLYNSDGATLDDLRAAAITLKETEKPHGAFWDPCTQLPGGLKFPSGIYGKRTAPATSPARLRNRCHRRAPRRLKRTKSYTIGRGPSPRAPSCGP